MNFAALDSERRPFMRDLIVVSFFFDGRGADIHKSPLGMFRSLLNQILPHFPNKLIELTSTFHSRCQTKGKVGEKWNWNVGELEEFLASTLCEVSSVKPILVYLDALDEAGEGIAVRLVGFFKRVVSNLAHTKASLRVCLSCRHYPIISLNHGLEICVENENQMAVQTHVKQELANQGLASDTARILEHEIVGGAQGVFQWVVLVIPKVLSLHRKGKGLGTIRSHIQATPRELYDLYQSLLKFSEEEDRLESLRLLEWICFATRPLTLQELQHAMAVSASESFWAYQESNYFAATEEQFGRRVIDLSKGLAEINQAGQNRIVQLAHQSVSDFLTNYGLKMLQNFPKDTASGHGHLHLSISCVRYLSMTQIWELEDWETIFSSYTLLQYASASWTFHAEKAEKEGLAQDHLLGLFKWPSNDILERWIEVFGVLYPYRSNAPLPGVTLLHVAARHGLSSVVAAILDDNSTEEDVKDSEGRTALSWAAENGHEVLVRCLLSTRWVKPDSRDINVRTPLFYAATNDHLAVTDFLLAVEEVDPNIADCHGQTPLRGAATKAGKAVMEVFLHRRGTDIRITEDVFKAAAGNSKDGKEVISLLLEQRDAEVTITEEVVKVIAGECDEQAMSLLLEQRGAEVTITEEVVEAAAGNCGNGKEAMSLLLEQRGPEVTVTEKVVKAAAGNTWNGFEVMSLLLEQREAEVTITEEVVKAAAGNCGNGKEVMSLLLEQRGAEVTITEEVVKAAAGSWGNGFEVMSLLLEQREAEVTITEEVVEAAAGNCGNGKEVMSLLLEQRGADITTHILPNLWRRLTREAYSRFIEPAA
jgi:ankyrin repeat protein